MDIAQKIYLKLQKILNKLKALKVIQTFELKINFCKIEDSIKTNLKEIDSTLKKCLKKIILKPKKAEIRNVITKLVKRKNSKVSVLSHKKELCKSLPENFFSHKVLKESPKSKENFTTKPKSNKTAKEFTSERRRTAGVKQEQKQIQNSEGFCGIINLECHEKEQISPNFSKCQSCLACKEHKKDCLILEGKSDKMPLQCRNISSDSDHTKLVSLAGSLATSSKNNFKFKTALIKSKRKEGSEPQKGILNNSLPKNKMNCPGQFTCFCGKVFRFKKTLKKHESVKHSSKIIKYTCTFCQKSFLEKGKLNRHMLSHKRNQYQCSFCLKQFARSDALKRHFSVAHSQKKEFACSFCQKKFSLKYNRDVHEECVHVSFYLIKTKKLLFKES